MMEQLWNVHPQKIDRKSLKMGLLRNCMDPSKISGINFNTDFQVSERLHRGPEFSHRLSHNYTIISS